MHIIAKKVVAEYKKKEAEKKALDEPGEDDRNGPCECLLNTCYKCLPCVCVPGNQPIPKSLWKRMWFEGTIANKRVKVVLGFASGVVLTTIIFYIMMVLFQTSLIPGLVTVALIATFLPLGLAYSPKVRAVTLLVIPSLVTDKGQALVIAYMLVIVTRGPVENFNYNSQMLAISVLCAQEQGLKALEERIDAAKRPIHVISQRMEDVINEYKEAVNKLEKQIDAMAANFENIMDEFERFKEYYDKVKNYCVRKHGTSKELRCKATAEADFDGEAERISGEAQVGTFAVPLIVDAVVDGMKEKADKAFCKGQAKVKDIICDTDIDIDIDVNLFAETRKAYREKAAKMKREVLEFFQYNVTFDRKSDLNRVRSINFTTIINNIRAELYSRVQIVAKFLQLTQYTLVLFSLLVVVMALLYLHKYHTKLHYDNHYINQFVMDLDARRTQLHKDKESIFPLSMREKFTYIRPTSRRLSKKEVFRTILNLLLMIPMLINLLLIAFCDIGLWFSLALGGKIISLDIEDEASGTFEVKVEGNGSRAKSYNDMLSKFSLDSNGSVKAATWNCRPSAQEPDWEKYHAMRNFIVYLVLMAIFQSYILRLRQVICSLCYPQRARERAAYMYNCILQLRGSLASFLRRQIRRCVGKEDKMEQVSLCHAIGARFQWLRPLLNALGYAQKYCLGCGLAGGVKDIENFVHCRNYGCTAVYCKACSNDLNNLCTACMHPIDYGDFGDISEEWDSSSDEDELVRKKSIKPEQQRKLATIQVQAEILREMLRRLHNREQGLASSSSSCSTCNSSCSECYQLLPVERHRHRDDSTEIFLGSRENISFGDEPSEYIVEDRKRKRTTRSVKNVDLEEVRVHEKADQKKTKKRKRPAN